MWKPLTREDTDRGMAFVSILRERPSATWEGLSDLESHILLWIKTVRETNTRRKPSLGMFGPDWLPSSSDFSKSALFERIRHGLQPLDEPPPLGYSCPWYAIVEETTPHNVYEARFGNPWASLKIETAPKGDNFVSVLQNTYEIVAVDDSGEVHTLRDRGHETSYRWRLWFDPTWKHPTAPTMQNGSWMMQIIT